MREIRVSSTLTVYFDGQFWVGMFECAEDDQISVCHVVFGAEPSVEEIQRLVCADWNRLRFTRPIALQQAVPRMATNPKRRQRDASRELKVRGPSSRSQLALSKEREAEGQRHKEEARVQRERQKRDRFEQRQKKRKQKHRGKPTIQCLK